MSSTLAADTGEHQGGARLRVRHGGAYVRQRREAVAGEAQGGGARGQGAPADARLVLGRHSFLSNGRSPSLVLSQARQERRGGRLGQRRRGAVDADAVDGADRQRQARAVDRRQEPAAQGSFFLLFFLVTQPV